MDRSLKSRVLTAADVMFAHECAVERAKQWAKDRRSEYSDDALADAVSGIVLGIEFTMQELLGLLAETTTRGRC